MSKITPEQEKEIFECYKAGMKTSVIRRMYQITNHQFQQIVRTGIRKENSDKNK